MNINIILKPQVQYQEQDGEKSYAADEIKNIRLVREGTKLYAEFNNSSNLEEVCDYDGLTRTFDYTLLFGTDLDGTMKPFRYAKGTLSNITVTNNYAYSELPITLPIPSRTGYRFRGWYTDPEFKNKAGNAANRFSSRKDVVLYAKWLTPQEVEEENANNHETMKTVYEHAEKIVFDGTNYINTGIKLWDYNNYQKDFEISFKIDSVGNIEKQSTLINAKYEVSPYPGFVYRFYTEGNVELTAAGGTGEKITKKTSTVSTVKIIRRNGIMYLQVNGGEEEQAYDFNDFKSFINTPLTIGASLDGEGKPFRYFKGEVSNILIKIEE